MSDAYFASSELEYLTTVCYNWLRDSVSSIGLRAKSPPIAPDSMNNICFFRHALALDERRVKFMPTYAQGPHPGADHARSMQIKEVWFPGTHRDM